MKRTSAERVARRAELAERAKRVAQAIAEARAVVRQGVCPQCGRGLVRNSALAGWWQCEQFGAEGFRKDSSAPSCSWQCFTE